MLLSAVYLIVIIVITSVWFPNAKSVSPGSVYERMRSESKEKLVYKEKPAIYKDKAEFVFVNVRPLFMRNVTTATVTVDMLNGDVLTFEAELPENVRQGIVREYLNIVKAETNKLRVYHLLRWFLWFAIPVAALYCSAWPLGWIIRSSKRRRQQAFFLLGIGIIVTMGLMPPWQYKAFCRADQAPITGMAGYGFLFSPALDSCPVGISEKCCEEKMTLSIDLTGLLVQWAVVIIGMGGLLIVLGDRQQEKR